MIAGFDFLSLTNFWGVFLKRVLRLLFVDQVCSAAENVNVALIHEDGFLLQRRAGAGLVPTCEEQTRVKKSSQPTGRLQIIVGASGCGPTVQTFLICLVLLDVKRDESDRSHSAGFTAMVDGVNVGLPWRREDHLTHIHITSVMLGSVSRVMFCRRHVSALSSPPRSPLPKEVIKDA